MFLKWWRRSGRGGGVRKAYPDEGGRGPHRDKLLWCVVRGERHKMTASEERPQSRPNPPAQILVVTQRRTFAISPVCSQKSFVLHRSRRRRRGAERCGEERRVARAARVLSFTYGVDGEGNIKR